MPGPIQSAISNAVGNIAQTAVEVKQIKAQQKTAAELEATRKENAKARDTAEKTKAISDFQNDILADTEKKMSTAMNEENRKPKAERRSYSQVYDSVMGKVMNEYSKNPARMVQYGYSHGINNPETGQPYSQTEFAKALQDLQKQQHGRLEGKFSMFFEPKMNKKNKETK